MATFSMTEVINFTKRLKEKEEIKKEEEYIDQHCFVLDHCDDIFEGTLLITKSDDGEIQFSASGIEDYDEMMDMLASCIFKIKGIT